ncbi:hypothetical protein KA977_09510 [Candidatus Dependentiae bacterium]|nr:hypothetical protein [Candidatus Dependentiae bacterium]
MHNNTMLFDSIKKYKGNTDDKKIKVLSLFREVIEKLDEWDAYYDDCE